jgi:hypothetical protein
MKHIIIISALLVTSFLSGSAVKRYQKSLAAEDQKTAVNFKEQMRFSYDVIHANVMCGDEWDCTRTVCLKWVKDHVSDARFDKISRLTCY